MRVKLEIAPASDLVWSYRDHYKFRGFVYETLDGSALQWIHDDYDTPKFCFSNPFSLNEPHRGEGTENILHEQENCVLLFSSAHDSLTYKFEHEVDNRNSIEIGDKKFYVDGSNVFDYTVNIGESGVLTTPNGVVARMNKEERDKHGINEDSEKYGIAEEDFQSSWLPNHGLDVFEEQLLSNLHWKLDSVDADVRHPESIYDIFDHAQYKTTFETKLPVKTDLELTFHPSTFEFGYTVQTAEQAAWINMLLQAGVCEKNPLGFGFLNKD